MNDSASTLATLPELSDVAEQIGEFIHYWGFKRVHGRIWTHLFLSPRPLDAADLVRKMDISKALISISLRELLEYDVIMHAGRSDRGTHVYRTNPDILTVILTVLRQREKRLVSRVSAAHEGLSRVGPEELERHEISPERLVRLGGLTSHASATIDGLIALTSVDFGDWRKAFMTEDDATASSEPGGSGGSASGSASASSGHGRPLGIGSRDDKKTKATRLDSSSSGRGGLSESRASAQLGNFGENESSEESAHGAPRLPPRGVAEESLRLPVGRSPNQAV